MKPTQQEIIELAQDADTYADESLQCIGEYHPDWHTVRDERFAALLLERFGAGGGEPVEWMSMGQIRLNPPKNDHDTYVPLYTRPSPTDLRAEYLRGLEDAAKVCDEVSMQAGAAWKLAYKPQDQGRETGADECADAIRALKGKQ